VPRDAKTDGIRLIPKTEVFNVVSARAGDASFRMSATANDCDNCWSAVEQSGGATPWACQDSANTKAAYRFFGSDRISEANILTGHFASTREWFVAGSSSPVLILHDTTGFSYRHEDTAPIGIRARFPFSMGKKVRRRSH
jgi:hypothetical protein